jgi:hypothetical protein
MVSPAERIMTYEERNKPVRVELFLNHKKIQARHKNVPMTIPSSQVKIPSPKNCEQKPEAFPESEYSQPKIAAKKLEIPTTKSTILCQGNKIIFFMK